MEQRRATYLDHDVGALLDRHFVRAGWGSRGKRMSAGEGARVCFIAAVQTTFYRFDRMRTCLGPRQAQRQTHANTAPDPGCSRSVADHWYAAHFLCHCTHPVLNAFFLSSPPCLSLALSAPRSPPGSGSSRDSGASSSHTPTGTRTSRATGNWG